MRQHRSLFEFLKLIFSLVSTVRHVFWRTIQFLLQLLFVCLQFPFETKNIPRIFICLLTKLTKSQESETEPGSTRGFPIHSWENIAITPWHFLRSGGAERNDLFSEFWLLRVYLYVETGSLTLLLMSIKPNRSPRPPHKQIQFMFVNKRGNV